MNERCVQGAGTTVRPEGQLRIGQTRRVPSIGHTGVLRRSAGHVRDTLAANLPCTMCCACFWGGCCEQQREFDATAVYEPYVGRVWQGQERVLIPQIAAHGAASPAHTRYVALRSTIRTEASKIVYVGWQPESKIAEPRPRVLLLL